MKSPVNQWKFDASCGSYLQWLKCLKFDLLLVLTS